MCSTEPQAIGYASRRMRKRHEKMMIGLPRVHDFVLQLLRRTHVDMAVRCFQTTTWSRCKPRENGYKTSVVLVERSGSQQRAEFAKPADRPGPKPPQINAKW